MLSRSLPLAAALLTGALVTTACGSTDDAGIGDPNNPGGGGDPAENLEPATVNADGVLTNRPDISFFRTGSAILTITTANFVLLEDGDDRGPLLQFMGEFRNDDFEGHCFFLPDVSLDYQEIITQAHGGPAYEGENFSTVMSCVGPGLSGVYYGVARGISQDDIDSGFTLSYDFGPSPVWTPDTAFDEPTLSRADVIQTDSGWIVDGDLRANGNFYNSSISIYPRDSRGLITDELKAFPRDLGDIFKGEVVGFQTDAHERKFDDYLYVLSWISRDR